MILLKDRRLRARMGLAALGGVVAALGLAPLGIWPLTLLALAAVPSLMLAATSTWQAALTGWALGTGYFALGLVWIVEPFLVEPERFGWMAPFALVFMAGGLALFWGLAFGLAHLLGRMTPQRVALRIWGLIALLSLAEFGRAYLLTGFPWAGLAQIWTDTSASLLLAWIGPQGLGLATLLAALPAGLIAVRPMGQGTRLAQVTPALLFAGSAIYLGQVTPEAALTGSSVRLVQPNAPQDQKWDPAYIPVFFKRQIDFTAAASETGTRPDLIVWPETAVPTSLAYAGPTLERITRAAGGAPVVLGILRRQDARVFNSLIYLDETGALGGIYDKAHLVPFGEYIPFGDFFARFGIRGLAAQDGDSFSAGPGPQLMSFGRIGKGVPLICYEAVFPQDVSAAPGRADFLLQITNDAWFGKWIGPYQHLAQARMRAIEQGLPMIRAANTGVSAMIDPFGRITKSIPLGQAGFVDAALPAPLAPTLYSRTGDLPVFLLLLAVTSGLWGLQWRRRQRS
jgi:apolipoprotein N-acyltransferase